MEPLHTAGYVSPSHECKEKTYHASLKWWLEKIENGDMHMSYVLYCYDKYHDHKQLGRKGFISAYSFMAQSITEGNHEWNLEVGADPEVMEECCLLAFSDCLLITSGPPVQEQYCTLWAGPSHINHQSRKWTTGLSINQSNGDAFLIEVPFSKVTLACIKLTWKCPVQTNK